MSLAQLDAMTVGDKITVVEYLRHPEDKSFQGDLLTVVAVDSPFVIVRRRYSEDAFALDARTWTFKKLSPQAATALEPHRSSELAALRSREDGRP